MNVEGQWTKKHKWPLKVTYRNFYDWSNQHIILLSTMREETERSDTLKQGLLFPSRSAYTL